MQMRFTQAQLTNLFKQFIEIFFQKETNHVLSGVAERSLFSRLAIYLEQLMPGFPDNLIAIEIKKSNRPESEKTGDRNRLSALTKKHAAWNYDIVDHPKHVSGYTIRAYMQLDQCAFFKGFKKIEVVREFRNVRLGLSITHVE